MTRRVLDGQVRHRQGVYIRVVRLHNRYQTAEATAQTIPALRRISGRTVRNRLNEHGIHPCRPCVRPLLLPRHRMATMVTNPPEMETYRVGSYTLHQCIAFLSWCLCGRQRVHRRTGERCWDGCVAQRRHYSCGSVMVLGWALGA